MVHRVENPHPYLSCNVEQLQHMRNAIISLCDALDAIPYFSALGNEIVVGIDHQKPGNLLFKRQIGHNPPPMPSWKQPFSQGVALDTLREQRSLLADYMPRRLGLASGLAANERRTLAPTI